MEKHIVDEKTGISYTLQGDYYIPDFTLPPETDNRPIGVWGAVSCGHLCQRQKHRPSQQARPDGTEIFLKITAR